MNMIFHQASNDSKRERGATVIELIVSLTVFLIGVAALYALTQLAMMQKNTISSRTDQLRSARIALEYIRRDALNAGFGYHRTGGNIPDNAGNLLFSLASDSDTERDLLTSIVAGNDRTSNALSFGTKTDVVGFIARDPSFNNGALINYQSAAANGSVVEVRTANGGAAIASRYDLFLLESGSGTTQVVGMATNEPDNNIIQLARNADDPFALNQPANGTGFNQSLLVTTTGGGTIKRVNLVSYAVTPAGVLVRRRYGNRTGMTASEQLETRELVYGVSDFQVRYYMEDGTIVDDPSVNNNGRNNQLKMNNVVQIQVSLTLAADNADGLQKITMPITIKEFISTKNLRYEAS